MNEKMRDYLLYGVAALTAINTILIFTQDNGGGRVIDRPATNTALVESNRNVNQAAQIDPAIGQNRSFDAASGRTDVNPQQQQQQQQPPAPAGPPTTIAFEQMEHDFGTIKQNTENKHIFSFVNTGPNPLIIQDAKGSCGCTVPKYPKQPVPPGETAEIEVVYKPGTQKGNQTKTVTLTANTEPNQTVLKISAMVEPEEKES